MKRTLLPLLAGIAGAVVALVGGVWAANALLAPNNLATDDLHATWMGEGRALPDVELVDHEGTPFTRGDLEGGWTLVFFGFTHCPDICPMTLSELGRVQHTLEEQGLGDAVRTVFITVDPARDTRERLEGYVTNFHDDFRGVTGELDEIDRLARTMGIAHVRHDEEGGDDYMVDHGGSLLLVNPQGRLQAMFGTPHRADEISDDLVTILQAHGGT